MSVYTQNEFMYSYIHSHLHCPTYTHTTLTQPLVCIFCSISTNCRFLRFLFLAQLCFGQLTPQPTPGISLTTAPPPPLVSHFSFPIQPSGVPEREGVSRSRCPEPQLSFLHSG